MCQARPKKLRIEKYLSKRRVPHVLKHETQPFYNFQALVGGKYNLTNAEQFINLYAKAVPKLQQKGSPTLVFRPSKNCPLFYLDIDLRSDREINVPPEVFVKITQELLTILKQVLGTNDVWKVVLTKRVASYFKGGNVKKHCGGFHILIPDLFVSVEQLQQFKTAALNDLYWHTLLDGYGITNPPGGGTES